MTNHYVLNNVANMNVQDGWQGAEGESTATNAGGN
jgi:hypothetical protein